MMIQHREREVVLMVLAIDGVALEVVQRVVHPAHVPLKRETKAAQVGRARDQRPRSRFLGDSDDTGMLRMHNMIEVAQELDGFKILATSKLVRKPLALTPRVVKVKHRRDSIDAKAVDVKTVAP